jgi:hypothetical protein
MVPRMHTSFIIRLSYFLLNYEIQTLVQMCVSPSPPRTKLCSVTRSVCLTMIEAPCEGNVCSLHVTKADNLKLLTAPQESAVVSNIPVHIIATSRASSERQWTLGNVCSYPVSSYYFKQKTFEFDTGKKWILTKAKNYDKIKVHSPKSFYFKITLRYV